jgi:hypothetical protein
VVIDVDLAAIMISVKFSSNQGQRCRLPSAVRPDKRKDLTVHDSQGEIVDCDGGFASELFFEALRQVEES